MRSRPCLLACSLFSFFAPSVGAQDATLAGPGSRVRIRMAASATLPDRVALQPGVVGTLVRVDDDRLTLKLDGTDQTLGVARRSIVRFEVSAGKRSRMKNALLGAAVGVGGSALFLVAYFGAGALRDGSDFAASTIMVSSLTVPVSALIGAVLPTPERWKELPVDRIRVSVAPVRGRGVAVSLQFGLGQPAGRAPRPGTAAEAEDRP